MHTTYCVYLAGTNVKPMHMQPMRNILVKDNEYKNVLRITSNAAGFMDLKIAKEAGAEVCSVRSSNSSDGTSWKSRVIHIVSSFLV